MSEQQQPRRRRNPVYHVFELVPVEKLIGTDVLGDVLGELASEGSIWVQVGRDIPAASDTDAIAAAVGADETALEGRTFWAPLTRDYRPRTRKVTHVPQGRWA